MSELCRAVFHTGGSWVVISGVISPRIWVITIVTLLITLLITTHEPPSKEPPKQGPVPPSQSSFSLRAHEP